MSQNGRASGQSAALRQKSPQTAGTPGRLALAHSIPLVPGPVPAVPLAVGVSVCRSSISERYGLIVVDGALLGGALLSIGGSLL